MSYLHDWRPNIALSTSLTLSVWVSIVHVFLLALLPFWQADESIRLLIASGVVASWSYLYRRYVILHAKGSVTRLIWCSDGWVLETQRGIEGPFVLAGSSRITRRFILLHFKRPSDRLRIRFAVPILEDSVGDENFRLLQVFLRWQRASVLNPSEET